MKISPPHNEWDAGSEDISVNITVSGLNSKTHSKSCVINEVSDDCLFWSNAHFAHHIGIENNGDFDQNLTLSVSANENKLIPGFHKHHQSTGLPQMMRHHHMNLIKMQTEAVMIIYPHPKHHGVAQKKVEQGQYCPLSVVFLVLIGAALTMIAVVLSKKMRQYRALRSFSQESDETAIDSTELDIGYAAPEFEECDDEKVEQSEV